MVGRFNPLTIHHRKVFESMPGPRIIAITGSSGPKDPLSQSSRLLRTFNTTLDLDRTYPYWITPVKDVIAALRLIGGLMDHPNVILHCGSDRAEDYQRLNTYTKETGVGSISIVGYERESDEHSATHLRELAVNDCWKEFNKLCGYTRKTDRIHAYNEIRSYYASVQG